MSCWELRVTQPKSKGHTLAKLPGIVSIKLSVPPATERDGSMVYFHIVCERQIAIQQVGCAVSSLRVATRDNCRSVTTCSATSLLVLNVVAIQCSESKFVSSDYFREVIFPTEEVFVILPGSLVPDIVVAPWSPHYRRHIGIVRKYRRKLR